jgi:hypothetical protein
MNYKDSNSGGVAGGYILHEGQNWIELDIPEATVYFMRGYLYCRVCARLHRENLQCDQR